MIVQIVVLLGLAAQFGPAQVQKKEKDELPAVLRAKPMKPAAGDSDLQKLLKERYNERLGLTLADFRNFQAGKIHLDVVLDSARRLANAGLDVHKKVEDRVAFLTQVSEIGAKLGTTLDDREKQGQKTVKSDRARVREFTLEVEIQILKAKGGKG